MRFLKKLATSPLTIIGAILAGALLGLYAPALAKNLKFIGDIYIDLLKMIILPFLVSAVIVSINRLARDPSASRYLGRIALCLIGGMALAGFVGVVYMYLAQPGSHLDQSALHAFGRLVQADASGVETSIRLFAPTDSSNQNNMASGLLMRLIPDNIFHALSFGDTLKTLFFALMFGFALATAPKEKSINFIECCETVFRACQRLTTWLLYFLPIASFALAADQIAGTGLEPLKVMVHFIIAFTVVTALLLGVCLLILYRKSNQTFMSVLRAQEGPFFIAVATRNSAACMPAMMTSLVDRLGFSKSVTELLVPLGTALFRVGPTLYYCMAAIFIAQLYGRELSMGDYGIVLLASMIAGFSSTGMNGIVTISQTTIVCSLLGLPFEAAFVLFVAVEPICDTLRTVLLVFSINALTALIAPLENETADTSLPQASTA
ncbi:MAG: cation:dicarboxylase symporter family transporter [Proteobacteria bacterium]|nr:cation:dicarboxylase symporter family transporter [Pseudomonadota bacterium]